MSVLAWFPQKQPETKACSRKLIWEFDPREQELEGSENREGAIANLRTQCQTVY